MNNSIDNPNVCQLFHDIARGNDRPAIIMPGRGRRCRVSFHELHEGSLLLGSSLREIGLQPGDRAIIMIPMSIDLYMTLLAVVSIGATAVFVDPWIPPRQMAAFAQFAEPTAFIGIGKSHWLRRMEPELKQVRKKVTTGHKFLWWPAKYRLPVLKLNMEMSDVVQVDEEQPALITFTSGSSGQPKGANRTHRFLRAQHEALEHEFPCQADDIDMPTFPVFALNNLVSGITSVVPDMDFKRVAEVDGNKIAKQMNQHGVTTCTVSPPFLDRLCDYLDGGGRRPGLRRVLTGGAPVSRRQLKRWQDCLNETEIIVAYGSTEAEPVAHISSGQRLSLDEGLPGYCTGQLVSRIDARVIEILQQDEAIRSKSLDELTLPAGQIGELVVSGDHVCRDYFRNPEANAENKIVDPLGVIW
ncbi:MAG: AMP-binding protein, partial [Pirellulaceae bacterium]